MTAHPILIAGPTASGKSALAMAIAERVGGVVINADSMQVYRELPILTAQPSAEERARVPHRLYGHVSARDAYSVARWIDDVRGEFLRAQAERLRPIVIGGTGLYFKALFEGLSPVPAIPDDVRRHWRAMAAAAPSELHAMLRARDAEMAARLDPGDTQRLTRALEVIAATGRSLASWQSERGRPVVAEASCVRLVVRWPRADLALRADQRFDAMIDGQALAEVAAFLQLGVPVDAPAARAIGVQPLAAHLAGELDLEASVAAAKLATRQYIRRQETWLKRYMISWKPIYAQQLECFGQNFEQFIDC